MRATPPHLSRVVMQQRHEAARLAERMEAREQERQRRSTVVLRGDPEQTCALEFT